MINFRRVNYVKFVTSLFLIAIFIFVIVYANKFTKGEDQRLAIDSSFIEGDGGVPQVDIDAISIDMTSEDNGIIQYIVQPEDTLFKIASMFGTTISDIQKTNDLKGEPKPGQTLKITDVTDNYIVYTVPAKTNIVVFANTYNLNIQDLMTLNYFQDENEIMIPEQEIAINISKEKAYELGLLEKPKPEIIPQTTVTYKPVINKSGKKSPGKKTSTSTTNKPTATTTKVKGDIISSRTYTKDISNSFARGSCTWYAAIVSPNIFPYTDADSQARSFGGNANQWCANAKEAGFRIGTKPSAGSIIVYSKLSSSAGHVGKVMSYDATEGKLVVRDMNYAGKFIVTERWQDADDARIKCYIYGK